MARNEDLDSFPLPCITGTCMHDTALQIHRDRMNAATLSAPCMSTDVTSEMCASGLINTTAPTVASIPYCVYVFFPPPPATSTTESSTCTLKMQVQTTVERPKRCRHTFWRRGRHLGHLSSAILLCVPREQHLIATTLSPSDHPLSLYLSHRRFR